VAKKRRTSRQIAPPPDSLNDLMAALNALMRQRDLDLDFSLRVQNLIGREVMRHKWTQAEKDVWRWAMVCEGIKLKKGWAGAPEYASEVLANHPAGAGPDMIVESYKRVQKKLKPFGQHRRRTWRKPR
jgi:hypothetical protein